VEAFLRVLIPEVGDDGYYGDPIENSCIPFIAAYRTEG
jgi:hypothetical protein